MDTSDIDGTTWLARMYSYFAVPGTDLITAIGQEVDVSGAAERKQDLDSEDAEDKLEEAASNAREEVLTKMRPSVLDLPPGSYWAKQGEKGTWRPVAAPPGDIPTLNPTSDRLAEPIDLGDIPNHADLAVFREDELQIQALEEGASGLATARPREDAEGTPLYFLKYSKRKSAKDFHTELAALRQYDHPSIIHLEGLLLDTRGDVIGLVLPYASLGSLDKHMASPDEVKIEWIRQIVCALVYIKRQGRRYVDVKCPNVVINDQGNALLIDFDGYATAGKNDMPSESFPIGEMMQDMLCSGEQAREFVSWAKAQSRSLEECALRLDMILSPTL
ncbi:kinase-like protein [Calocera cornea HHB12733]|uniref:Kinase-like protein n=1 Tax=Calocera cornea HHB12733 TaxID=1353952 RepID=A0A165BZE8_9BASI|nr:kinase-like protein [Calocera cornea HHB12733]